MADERDPVSIEPESVEPDVWTDSERKWALAVAVEGAVAKGRRVEHQADFSAVVMYGNRPNHLLHLLLCIPTAGLWSIVWVLLSVGGGEKREVIMVDAFGHVTVK